MQYLSNYVATTLPRILRVARRNAGKITLITLSTAGAAALAYHIHKTNNHITTTLNRERREGAERLRSQFLATRPSLEAAFRAIHTTILKTLQSHELSNPDPFLDLLRQNPSREEKTAIWRDVLYTSITKVCTCCVIASAVFVALSVEVELLAKYAGQDADSGVAATPKAIGGEAKAAYIDCVRDGAKSVLETLLPKVRGIVEDVFGGVGLTKKVKSEDMAKLIGEVVKETDINGLITGWFAEDGRDGEPGPEDGVVHFLKNETLDLLDILDLEDIATRATHLCSTELTANVNEGPLVGGLAALVKECDKDLGHVLTEDSELMEFGACVFLSGERRR